MSIASSFSTLFTGPSTGLVVAILVVAIGATGLVLWILIGLVVDRRAAGTDDTDELSLSGWDEAADPMYDDSYARARGDATG